MIITQGILGTRTGEGSCKLLSGGEGRIYPVVQLSNMYEEARAATSRTPPWRAALIVSQGHRSSL